MPLTEPPFIHLNDVNRQDGENSLLLYAILSQEKCLFVLQKIQTCHLWPLKMDAPNKTPFICTDKTICRKGQSSFFHATVSRRHVCLGRSKHLISAPLVRPATSPPRSLSFWRALRHFATFSYLTCPVTGVAHANPEARSLFPGPSLRHRGRQERTWRPFLDCACVCKPIKTKKSASTLGRRCP